MQANGVFENLNFRAKNLNFENLNLRAQETLKNIQAQKNSSVCDPNKRRL